jgi:hypothetical protein
MCAKIEETFPLMKQHLLRQNSYAGSLAQKRKQAYEVVLQYEGKRNGNRIASIGRVWRNWR